MLILASKSPYRKQLLARLGVDFETCVSDYDESTLKQNWSQGLDELAVQLAIGKARAVQKKFPQGIIIGSDQVCELAGEALSKTGDLELSEQQLTKMSGKTHYLHTAYAIIGQDKITTHCNTTTLDMVNLTNDQIKKYLRSDNPIDCAGSYKLELRGISLMKKVETSDQTAVMGLPLIQLANDLRAHFGMIIPPKL